MRKEIDELKKKLVGYQQVLKEIENEIRNLKDHNRSQINQKEKELEEWRQKLETLQQERNQIKKEMKEKITELEKSQLSEVQKQAQINQLLTQNSTELEEVDKLLYDERTHYRQIRDKMISKLYEPCEGCRVKEQSIQTKDRKIVYLFSIIGLMLILFFLFHL